MKIRTAISAFIFFPVAFLLLFCGRSELPETSYTLTEKDLIPEGIAFSAETNSFYIGSIAKQKIVKIDAATGSVADFVKTGILEMAVLGIAADDDRKLLWACANITQNDKRESAVFKIDLLSGRLVKSFGNNTESPATFNDVAFDSSGSVYITDTDGDRILSIEPGADSLSLFYHGAEIHQPNGIAISPDNKYLYVASQTRGIITFSTESREITGGLNTSVNSLGIDGLEYFDHSLIGLQNDVSAQYGVRINRYYLNQEGTAITGSSEIDKDNGYFHIPTTFAMRGEEIFLIANSQMDHVNFSDYKIINHSALKDVIILRYCL